MVKEQKKVEDNQKLTSQPGRKTEFVKPEFGVDTHNGVTITSRVEPGTRVFQVGVNVKHEFELVPGLDRLLDIKQPGLVLDWGNGQQSPDTVKDPSEKSKSRIRSAPAGKKYKIPNQSPAPKNVGPQHMSGLGSNGIVNNCDPMRYA